MKLGSVWPWARRGWRSFSWSFGTDFRLVLWSVIGGGLITLYARRFLHPSIVVSNENEVSVILFVMLFLSLIGFLACCVPVHRAVGEDPLAAIGQR